MKKTFGILLLMAMQAGHLFSQPASVGPVASSSGPLFRNRAPDFASWTVLRRFGEVPPNGEPGVAEGSGAPADRDPGTVTLTVVKTGKIYRASVADGRGGTREVWSDGSIVAVEPNDGGEAQFAAPPADRDTVNPLYKNFGRSDFDGFDWISSKNFRGTEKVQGRECLVFSETVRTRFEPAPGEKGPARESVEELEAYIDAATRLPVTLKNANGIFTYKFLAPPEAMLAFPASVMALVEKRRQIERSLAGRAAKPF